MNNEYKGVSVPEELHAYKVTKTHAIYQLQHLNSQLTDYKQELHELRKKYGADEVEKNIRDCQKALNQAEDDILATKYKYIAACIYDAMMFTKLNTSKKFKLLSSYLYSKFGIRYSTVNEYATFEEFYAESINVPNRAIDLNVEHNEVYVVEHYECAGEYEDTLKLSMPILVIADYEYVGKCIKEWVNDYLKEQRQQEVDLQRQQEEAEYAEYIRLRDKYEDKGK